jgi:iron transport multicopper oxidase
MTRADWHLNTGFAVVMAEDVPDIASVDKPSAAWSALCPAYNTYAAAHGLTPN